VIGIVEQFKRRVCAEAVDHRLQQRQVGQFVAGALQEQHRHLDVEQMLRAFLRRLAGRVQRRSARPFAKAVMKVCSIPAPAPCAKT